VADTVQFLPENIPIPVTNTDTFLRQAVGDIVSLLKNENKLNLPQSQFGNNTQNALVKIAQVLNRSVTSTSFDNQTKEIGVAESRVKPSVKHRMGTNSGPHENWKSIIEKIREMKRTLDDNPKYDSIHMPTPKSISKPSKEEMLYQHIFPHGTPLTEVVYHIFNDDGKRQNIDKLLLGTMKIIWAKDLENELGCLSDGIPNELLGTKTIQFVFKHEVPKEKKVTYANMVCDHRPLKTEKYRMRLTIGGDKLIYTSETA